MRAKSIGEPQLGQRGCSASGDGKSLRFNSGMMSLTVVITSTAFRVTLATRYSPVCESRQDIFIE